MIGKLGLDDFPLTSEQAKEALQAIAKEIHARYRSPFTLLLILPQTIWLGKQLENFLNEDGAHPLTVGVGIMPTTDNNGKPTFTMVEPPSVHAIRGKKVVAFDATGSPIITYTLGNFLKAHGASSVEFASFFTNEAPVKWINPDYVGFQLEKNTVVSGLGVGYTQEQASGGVITAALEEAKVVEEVNAVKLEEVEHEHSGS